MSDIVAIGLKDQVTGFEGVGVKSEPIQVEAEFEKTLREVVRRTSVEIVLVTETFAENDNARAIKQARAASGKVIIVIPDHHGSKGLAYTELRRDVERALGVDLLKS